MSTILIAEPQGSLRELLRVVLDLRGHEPVTHDVPGSIARDDMAALIVDPRWPAGLRCARRLRLRLPDLPIVCVSADEQRTAAEELGAASSLVMPFRLGELEAAVNGALQIH